MSVATKLASFGSGIIRGMELAQIANQRRQSLEFQQQDQRFQLEDRVRARFDRGDRDGAIAQAERLGLTSLAEELRAAFSTGQAELARQGALKLGSQAAGAGAIAKGGDYSTLEQTQATRNTLSDTLTGLRSNVAAEESLAGMQGTPGTSFMPGVAGPRQVSAVDDLGVQFAGTPGMFQKSPVLSGVGPEAREALYSAQQSEDQLLASMSASDKLLYAYRQLDDMANPDDRLKQINDLQAAHLEATGSTEGWPALLTRVNAQSQKARNDFMLSALPGMNSGDDIRKMIFDVRPDPWVSTVAESHAKLTDRKNAADVTEQQRFTRQMRNNTISEIMQFAPVSKELALELGTQAVNDFKDMGEIDTANALAANLPKMIQAASAIDKETWLKQRLHEYIEGVGNDPLSLTGTLKMLGFAPDTSEDNHPTFKEFPAPEEVMRRYSALYDRTVRVFESVDEGDDDVSDIVNSIVKQIPVVDGASKDSMLATTKQRLDSISDTMLLQQVVAGLDSAGIVIDKNTGRLLDIRSPQTAQPLDSTAIANHADANMKWQPAPQHPMHEVFQAAEDTSGVDIPFMPAAPFPRPGAPPPGVKGPGGPLNPMPPPVTTGEVMAAQAKTDMQNYASPEQMQVRSLQEQGIVPRQAPPEAPRPSLIEPGKSFTPRAPSAIRTAAQAAQVRLNKMNIVVEFIVMIKAAEDSWKELQSRGINRLPTEEEVLRMYLTGSIFPTNML